MASTKRTWLWVVLGIMGTLALIVVVVIGGAIFEFRRHVRTELIESQTAEESSRGSARGSPGSSRSSNSPAATATTISRRFTARPTPHAVSRSGRCAC